MSSLLRGPKKRLGVVHSLLSAIESKPASDTLILRVLFFSIVGGLLAALIMYSNSYLVATAASGGNLVEGIIGTPRFVNPALAVTRADQDMTALVYSGLMKINPDGLLVPDVAESVTVSDDGKTYNVILRQGVTFHDDTPLTAKDVAFTIALVQNSELKSPQRGNWSDVTVEEIGEYELNIILKVAYTPFIENFTLGILPRHIWSELPIEQVPFSLKNTEPIGSGPFSVNKITRDEAGLIKSYSLKKFVNNAPVTLGGVDVKFYQNEEGLGNAFTLKQINATAYLPSEITKTLGDNQNYRVIEEPLPRVFAVFFNQNRSPVLRDTTVRLALGAAIDRPALISSALSGYGVPITTPVPTLSSEVDSNRLTTEGDTTETPLSRATTILTKGGWIKNNTGGWEKRIDGDVRTLTIKLKTSNTPVFEATAEVIARAWRELGADVQIEQFEQSDLLQTAIRPRDFEALLFGLDMNRAVDLYPFWHSSQREDPGLNISQYANIEVDKLLDKARTATSSEQKEAALLAATNIMGREAPALFLYVPNFVYVIDNRISTPTMTKLSKPSERFMNVGDWHMNTDKLWPIFQ